MSNTKFTKGPWFIEHRTKGLFIFAGNELLNAGFNVCGVSGPDDYVNSLLIASSPDLYQQLEESNDCMLALADTLWECGHNITALKEQIKRNEFVLAKARGE